MVALRKTDMPTERYLTITEIADRLGFHRNTVKKWIETGQLAAVKIGKEYRVRPVDLEEFLRRRSTPKKDR